MWIREPVDPASIMMTYSGVLVHSPEAATVLPLEELLNPELFSSSPSMTLLESELTPSYGLLVSLIASNPPLLADPPEVALSATAFGASLIGVSLSTFFGWLTCSLSFEGCFSLISESSAYCGELPMTSLLSESNPVFCLLEDEPVCCF
ncbi:hypothetical protein WICPIJ_001337 [Wickerhamomyces pijperi]|uniref:Uncharacterized protein n=1 Tax=Wickerhamomyces pijperi TaxID=599730 RepID=A0A9P8QE57_WICPI|nr:hypothetical protein WICPIJ_001337 [Wickerhamomyces pijperi]